MSNTPAGGQSAKPENNVVELDAARKEGEAKGRTEALAYVNEVTALCALAKMPDRANGFITAATPIADVRNALLEASASEDANRPTGGHHSPSAGAQAVARPNLVADMKRRVGIA